MSDTVSVSVAECGHLHVGGDHKRADAYPDLVRAAIEAKARAEGPDCCDWEHKWPCPTIPRCDEPGCEKEATCGTPRLRGVGGSGYRRTCYDHIPEGWPEG